MTTLVYQDGFTRPPDVPPYVPQTNEFAAGGLHNIIGDGTGTRGSPPPILSYMLDDIPSTAPGWLVAGDPPGAVTSLDGFHGEPKFRAHANVSHILPDDPIRNYGRPGTSHLHQFFGNVSTNAFSTFQTLRHRANAAAAQHIVASTAAGGPYNGSGYWVPTMMKGHHVVKAGMFLIYYTANPPGRSLRAQRLPRGLRYVTGTNMDDPLDTIAKARIARANALSGNSGRYTYIGNGFNAPVGDGTWTSNHGSGWSMLEDDQATPVVSVTGDLVMPYFIMPDGSNPWPDMVTRPGYLKAFINGPVGYDGVNMWSPGGYAHVFNAVRDNYLDGECIPTGKFWLPELQIVPFYRHQGWADWSQWRLSSDDHAAMVAGMDAGEWPSGTSMHADWFGGWDDSVFGADTGWQIQCVAAKEGASPHECASGTFSALGTRLVGSIGNDPAPDGSRVPQLQLPEVYDTSVLTDMYAVPTSFTGPF